MFCKECGNKIKDNAVICVNCGVSVIYENDSINKYAGFWKRCAASIIDTLIGVISIFILTFMFSFIIIADNPDTDTDTMIAVSQIIFYILGGIGGWLYFALMESSTKQATLGKMALGIIVTDLDGNPISFGRATGRHFGKIISGCICYIGYLMAAFTEKKQGLHDIMAASLVITK